MRFRILSLVPAALACLALSSGVRPASAQLPEKFTNLKILPRNISRDRLLGTMQEFSGALGVRCHFCHADADTTKSRGLDYASDAREEKRIARAMMKMAGEINGKLLPRARIESPVTVGCVTCHHGVQRPETLADVLKRTAAKEGLPAAEQQYRDLRAKYYGSGAYDFRPGSLTAVAEWLAGERKDLDGALAVAAMSVEMDPDAAEGYVTLGRVQALRGEKGAAVASFHHALALEPNNRSARELLKSVESGE
ncbi:MAG TPA: c-type cytochrome [Candidatus Eisenbacteria bacterium]